MYYNQSTSQKDNWKKLTSADYIWMSTQSAISPQHAENFCQRTYWKEHVQIFQADQRETAMLSKKDLSAQDHGNSGEAHAPCYAPTKERNVYHNH